MASWIPKDFAAALLLVLSSNFLFCSSVATMSREQIRLRSFRFATAVADRLEPAFLIDLVILGDSRSRQIDTDLLCTKLMLQHCVNLGSMAGSWDTVYEIYRHAEDTLAPDAVVVLGVSDFWLEMGGRNPHGILPYSTAYAALGDTASTLESFFPLSTTRDRHMRFVRAFLSDAGGVVYQSITGRRPPPAHVFPPTESELERSNVDLWYRPGRAADRRYSMALARRTLEHLTANRTTLVIVYLPNPVDRERYVDIHYEGRRARFFRGLDALASEFDVPLVNLSGQLPNASLYKDFHHLNKTGASRATNIIARRLAAILDRSSHTE